MAGIKSLWWHDLRATFCTRLAIARYEALTIMSLMGHKDLKTTMRYIRAVQLQRDVRPINLSTNWPQMNTAASDGSRKFLSDLGNIL